MALIIYRHAEPTISANEIISGRDFPLWVRRYNESGIIPLETPYHEEKIVYTSNLPRSIETGYALGKKINITPLLHEAGIPLIKFPAVNIKANLWLVAARILWLSGFNKDCESFSVAKNRAGQVVKMFKTIILNEQRIVAVGHGFMNRLIKKELLASGFKLKQPSNGHDFLSRTIFEIDY